MDLVILPYIFLCLVLVFFFFAIPPLVRRSYNKYDKFEKITDISKKHNIMKPGYLMLNLDYQHEDPWFFRWISLWSEKIPRNTDAPILFLKKTIASIDNKEEKKIYTEWLINQLSEKISRCESASDEAFFRNLQDSIYALYIAPTNKISNSLILDDASIVEYAKKMTCKGKGPNCPEVLKRYVEYKAKFPEMDKQKIFIKKEESGNKIEDLTSQSSYYNWVKAFEDNKEKLKSVVENSEKIIKEKEN